MPIKYTFLHIKGGHSTEKYLEGLLGLKVSRRETPYLEFSRRGCPRSFYRVLSAVNETIKGGDTLICKVCFPLQRNALDYWAGS